MAGRDVMPVGPVEVAGRTADVVVTAGPGNVAGAAAATQGAVEVTALVRQAGPGRLPALLAKYPQHEAAIRELASIDPSGRQYTYLDWLVRVKVLRAEAVDLEALSSALQLFQQERRRFPSSDIGRYSAAKLIEAAAEVRAQVDGDARAHEDAVNNYRVIYSKDGTTITEIFSYEAMVNQGTGSWCVGYDDTTEHWDSYTAEPGWRFLKIDTPLEGAPFLAYAVDNTVTELKDADDNDVESVEVQRALGRALGHTGVSVSADVFDTTSVDDFQREVSRLLSLAEWNARENLAVIRVGADVDLVCPTAWGQSQATYLSESISHLVDWAAARRLLDDDARRVALSYFVTSARATRVPAGTPSIAVNLLNEAFREDGQEVSNLIAAYRPDYWPTLLEAARQGAALASVKREVGRVLFEIREQHFSGAPFLFDLIVSRDRFGYSIQERSNKLRLMPKGTAADVIEALKGGTARQRVVVNGQYFSRADVEGWSAAVRALESGAKQAQTVEVVARLVGRREGAARRVTAAGRDYAQEAADAAARAWARHSTAMRWPTTATEEHEGVTVEVVATRNGGQVLAHREGQLQGFLEYWRPLEPKTGRVLEAPPYIFEMWAAPEVRGGALMPTLFAAYRAHVSSYVVVAGPFSPEGRAAASRYADEVWATDKSYQRAQARTAAGAAALKRYWRIQPKGAPLLGWTTTNTTDVACEACGGCGYITGGPDDELCEACHGRGEVENPRREGFVDAYDSPDFVPYDGWPYDSATLEVVEFYGADEYPNGDFEGIAVRPVQEVQRTPLDVWRDAAGPVEVTAAAAAPPGDLLYHGTTGEAARAIAARGFDMASPRHDTGWQTPMGYGMYLTRSFLTAVMYAGHRASARQVRFYDDPVLLTKLQPVYWTSLEARLAKQGDFEMGVVVARPSAPTPDEDWVGGVLSDAFDVNWQGKEGIGQTRAWAESILSTLPPAHRKRVESQLGQYGVAGGVASRIGKGVIRALQATRAGRGLLAELGKVAPKVADPAPVVERVLVRKFSDVVRTRDLLSGWEEVPVTARAPGSIEVTAALPSDDLVARELEARADGRRASINAEGTWYHGSRHRFDSFQTSVAATVDLAASEVPIFLTKSRDFAALHAGHHGVVYEVTISNGARIFEPGADLVVQPYTGRYWPPEDQHLTPLGREARVALGRGELISGVDDSLGDYELNDYFKSMLRAQWDFMESGGVKAWVREHGFDGFAVRGEDDTAIAVFDPSKLTIVRAEPSAPDELVVTAAGALVVREWTVPGAPDDAFGRAGWVEADGLHTIHVTSDPDGFRAAVEHGQWSGAAGDLGPGIYGSATPAVWTARATRKWDFLAQVEQDAALRQRLGDAILSALPRQSLTDAEIARAERDVRAWQGGQGYIIGLAGQPYNVPFWRPEFLGPLGIDAGPQPAEVEVVGQGTFAELRRHPTADEAHALAQRYDGAFVRAQFSYLPEVVFYRPGAVRLAGAPVEVTAAADLGRRVALETAQEAPIEQLIDQLAGGDLAYRQQLEAAAQELIARGLDDQEVARGLTQIRRRQRLERNLQDIPGAAYAGETERHWVYQITSWQGARALGSPNWCIVRQQSFWDDYARDGISFYFYVDRQKGPPATYAVATSPQGAQEVYDQDDTLLDVFDEDVSPTYRPLDSAQREEALRIRGLQQAMARGTMPLDQALACVRGEAGAASVYFFGAMLRHPDASKLVAALSLDDRDRAEEYWSRGWRYYADALTSLGYIYYDDAAVLAASFVPDLDKVQRRGTSVSLPVTTTLGDGRIITQKVQLRQGAEVAEAVLRSLVGRRSFSMEEDEYYRKRFDEQVIAHLWNAELDPIVQVLLRFDEWAHGGDPYGVAADWSSEGFTPREVGDWLDAGIYDAGMAKQLEDEDISPDDLQGLDTKEATGPIGEESVTAIVLAVRGSPIFYAKVVGDDRVVDETPEPGHESLELYIDGLRKALPPGDYLAAFAKVRVPLGYRVSYDWHPSPDEISEDDVVEQEEFTVEEEEKEGGEDDSTSARPIEVTAAGHALEDDAAGDDPRGPPAVEHEVMDVVRQVVDEWARRLATEQPHAARAGAMPPWEHVRRLFGRGEGALAPGAHAEIAPGIEVALEDGFWFLDVDGRPMQTYSSAAECEAALHDLLLRLDAARGLTVEAPAGVLRADLVEDDFGVFIAERAADFSGWQHRGEILTPHARGRYLIEVDALTRHDHAVCTLQYVGATWQRVPTVRVSVRAEPARYATDDARRRLLAELAPRVRSAVGQFGDLQLRRNEPAKTRPFKNLTSIYELEYKWSKLRRARSEGPLADRAERQLAAWSEQLDRALNTEFTTMASAFTRWLRERPSDNPDPAVNQRLLDQILARLPQDDRYALTDALSRREPLDDAVLRASPEAQAIYRQVIDVLRTEPRTQVWLGVKRELAELEYASSLPLEKKIVEFHRALTTAHNNGTMPEHIYAEPGRRNDLAADVLWSLSNREVPPEWDAELARLLALPRGAAIEVTAATTPAAPAVGELFETSRGNFVVVDRDDSTRRVRISFEGGSYGPWLPTASFEHLGDIDGRLPASMAGLRSEDAAVDAVLRGEGEFLGKGNDGVVWRVGSEVVKGSTPVPYQPLNDGWLSPEGAIERLAAQAALQEQLATEGVPGVPRSRLVRVGAKAFQVKPYLDIPERLSRAQLDDVARTTHALHGRGLVFADSEPFQVGLDAAGRLGFFDLGMVQPGKANASRLWDEFARERDALGQLYRQHGFDFVPPADAGLADRWREVVDEGMHLWPADETMLQRFWPPFEALGRAMVDAGQLSVDDVARTRAGIQEHLDERERAWSARRRKEPAR